LERVDERRLPLTACADRAVERRDDSAGDGALEAERAADCNDGVADDDIGRVAKPHRSQVITFDMQYCQVVARTPSDDDRGNGRPVEEAYLDRSAALRRGDHVVVRQHVTIS
jgi:hypothetical protein